MDRLRPRYTHPVTFRLVSEELWLLPVHWSTRHRRTVICPGDRCPACYESRPKYRAYAVGKYKQSTVVSEVGLIEVGQLIVADLERHGLTDHQHAWGWQWEQEPAQDNIPRVTKAAQVPSDDGQLYTAAAIAAALEDLYLLPPTFGQFADRDHWLAHHHQMLRTRTERMFEAQR